MNKESNLYCVNHHLYNNLLSKLEALEIKFDRIAEKISAVKNLIVSSLAKVDTFIYSMEYSTKQLYERSATYRKHTNQHMKNILQTFNEENSL